MIKREKETKYMSGMCVMEGCVEMKSAQMDVIVIIFYFFLIKSFFIENNDLIHCRKSDMAMWLFE